MTKTGIWAIIIATAFIAGTLMANPFADAAGGWKEALENLTVDWSQLDNIPADIADGDDVAIPTYTVKNENTVNALSSAFVSVNCDGGDVAIGGGWSSVQANNAHDTLLQAFRNVPVALEGGEATGWSVGVKSERDSNSSLFQAWVICQDKPPLRP